MQTTYENNRKQIEAAVDTHGTLYDIRHILEKKGRTFAPISL